MSRRSIIKKAKLSRLRASSTKKRKRKPKYNLDFISAIVISPKVYYGDSVIMEPPRE